MVPQRIHAARLDVRMHGIYVYGPYPVSGTGIMIPGDIRRPLYLQVLRSVSLDPMVCCCGTSHSLRNPCCTVRRAYAWNIRVCPISGTSYDPYDLRGCTLTPVPTGTTVCIPGSHSACVSYIPNHPDWILYVCMRCVHM